MRASAARLSLLLLTLSSACYNPDLSGVVFRCSQEKPGCPSGHVCTDGYCRPHADAGLAADAGTAADAGSNDLSPIISGCADKGGTPLGPRAFACPGPFGLGQASKRCASGWRLCTGSKDVNQQACAKLPGFFVAEVAGSRTIADKPADAFCTPYDTFNQVRHFFGCGNTSLTYTHISSHMCSGFVGVLSCEAPWNCGTDFSPQTLDNTSQTAASDGVLCCMQ